MPRRARAQLSFALAVVLTTGLSLGPATSPANAEVWGACGLFDSSKKLVRTFSRAGQSGFPGHTANLKCGSENWGYRHVLIRHRGDWEAYSIGLGTNWRDFADWSIAQTLSRPGSVNYRASNQTWTYAAPIQIKNSRGAVIGTFNSTVSVASVSRNIITAYPGR